MICCLHLWYVYVNRKDILLIDQLKRSIAELECAKAMSLEKEIETLKGLERQKSDNELEAVNKVAEKYNKMKDFYNKLRVEHIELIRKVIQFLQFSNRFNPSLLIESRSR